MKLKKYLVFLGIILFLDIVFSLLINAHLLSFQKEYGQLEASISRLKKENQKISRRLVRLTSLKEIKKLGEEAGLGHSKGSIVFVAQEQFAQR